MSATNQIAGYRNLFVGICLAMILAAFSKSYWFAKTHFASPPLVPINQSTKQPEVTIRPRPTTDPSPDPAAPDPPRPTLKLTPVTPSSGAPYDSSVSMQQCFHAGAAIQCWGYYSVSSDIPVEVYSGGSTATDDQGHQYSNLAFLFSGSRNAKMIPDKNYRFDVVIDDPHPAVRSIGLIFFATEQRENQYTHDEIVFSDVPVQK
jgi:hypothetical protein